MSTPQSPAGRWSSTAPESPPGGQPDPHLTDPATEIEALAALLADVVDLTRSSAVWPGDLACIADQAQRFESVRAVLRWCR